MRAEGLEAGTAEGQREGAEKNPDSNDYPICVTGRSEAVKDGWCTAFGVGAELGFYRGRAEARARIYNADTR